MVTLPAVKNLKHGTMIAIAAGSLFASACKKEEKTAEPAKPATQEVAPTPKPDEAKPADPAPTPGSAAAAPGSAAEAAGSATAEKVAKVDCGGVNECKGKGTCKQEGHGCGGQNECKGKGVLSMTEDECKAKGGTVAAK